MSLVAELREAANEVAETMPALGKRLHMIAFSFVPLEELGNELVTAARDAEWREYVEARGVVAVGGWGLS